MTDDPRAVIKEIENYASKGAEASFFFSRSGVRDLLDASFDELAKAGLSERSAVFVRLIKETGNLYMAQRVVGKLYSPERLIECLDFILSGERVEKFMAVYLGETETVISLDILHEGTINQTAVYPRKALETAFARKARSVIFVHNHPSGDSSPSKLDRTLAAGLQKACSAVGLQVHDHLVIGKGRHFSARQAGWKLG